MVIVTGVVGHQSRRRDALRLAQEVRAVTAHLDDGELGCEDNHLFVLRTLMEWPQAYDWAVVLEDDAVPVPVFRFHVEHALRHAPAPVVGLYLGTGNPSGEVQRVIREAVVTAQARHLSWLVGDCLIPGVAYAIRFDVLGDMLAEISRRDEELPLRISRWAQSVGLPIAYTRPSLVNHADGVPIRGDVPGRMARRAWDCGTASRWDTPSVELGYCAGWSPDVTRPPISPAPSHPRANVTPHAR